MIRILRNTLLAGTQQAQTVKKAIDGAKAVAESPEHFLAKFFLSSRLLVSDNSREKAFRESHYAPGLVSRRGDLLVAHFPDPHTAVRHQYVIYDRESWEVFHFKGQGNIIWYEVETYESDDGTSYTGHVRKENSSYRYGWIHQLIEALESRT